MKKIRYLIALFLVVLCPLNVLAYSEKIIPGGNNIGIEINIEGVLVVGFYKINGEYNKGNPDINIGDYIIKVNDKDVNSINELIKYIDEDIKDDKVILTVKRDEQEIKIDFEVKLQNGIYKTGLYVKDKISGIGTVTYIDSESKIYGALGHEILESNTNRRVEVRTGEIYKSNVTGIDKSLDGNPGSKNAKIYYDEEIGSINKNTEFGIYGNYEDSIDMNKEVEILDIDDVKLGKAVIYTVLNGEEVKEYTIEITKIDKDADIKNFYFKITDKELLDKAGGVVQGMSGSPILQDGKILGAVTHVIIDDVKTGYGISIKTMLEEGDK